jgi:hypothetical protein
MAPSQMPSWIRHIADFNPLDWAMVALYNLVRLEKDTRLKEIYQGWMADLWAMNKTEGNSLFSFMTQAFFPATRPDPLALETLPSSTDTLSNTYGERTTSVIIASSTDRSGVEPNRYPEHTRKTSA